MLLRCSQVWTGLHTNIKQVFFQVLLTYLWCEVFTECFETKKSLSQVDICTIEEYTKKSMGGTGIGHNLKKEWKNNESNGTYSVTIQLDER